MKKPKVFFSTLFLLFFFGSLYSYAEVSIIQSSLSWRQDAAGDYVMPKPVNGEYSPAEFVATAGQIKSICVNYDATGRVVLEVSADSGLHYYAVINGVPLVSDFVSGDRLRWRAKLLDGDAKLNSLSITYTDSAGAIATFGSPQLSGFNYRKAILLKNPSQQELFNYQLKLKIEERIASSPAASRNDVIANPPKAGEAISVNCEGHILADFKDIRFTAADAQTPLPYYRESISGQSPKQVATFWVRVPQLPKDGVKIYIYYGNAEAPDYSSPKDTFDFYDDFKNAELDANSWTVKTDEKGSYALKDGQIKLDAAELITKDFIFKQGIVEYAVYVESGFENSLSLRTKTNGIYDNPGLIVYSSAYKGAEHCIAIDDIVKANDAKATPIAAAGKYNYRLTVNGKELTFERMDGATTEAQAKVNYTATDTLKPGYLGLKSGGDGGGRNTIAYSFIRVRKFAAPEPQVIQAGEEEQVRLPIFSNTTLSKKGSLILSDNSKEGTYISKTIPAAFTCRIMVPTFQGTQANVSISADNGANYKEDCASGDYYYSSRKDFTSGANIVAKVKLSPSIAQSVIAELEEVKLDYSPGTISMVKPNGSEAWGQGTSQEIFWSALGYDNEYPIKLEYSLDNGQAYTEIADKVENSGSYTWKIPENIKSTQALIRASDSNDPAVNDASDDVFTIQAAGAGAEKTEAKAGEEKEAEAGTIDLNKLSKAKQLPGTQLYDLLIKLGDNTLPKNPTEDARACFKEGDIVVVMPAGHNWSQTERESFLIIQAYLTEQEAQGLISPKTIDTGKKDQAGRSIKKLVKIRAKYIDLQKFGLAGNIQERAEKIEEIQNALKNKPIATGMIEQK